MPFYRCKQLAGVAIVLAACTAAAQPGFADSIRTQNPEGERISQVNRPPEEGTPRILTRGVRGVVKSVGGNRVTLEMEDGDTETYYIPAEFENRKGLEVGNEVILTIERGFVVAINTPEAVQEASTTVIRRERRVQREPAPTPVPAARPPARPAPVAPAPVVRPAPQPVRGMW